MPLFRGEIHTPFYEPGEVVEIDAEDLDRYVGDIEAGFLTPLSAPRGTPPLGMPEAEELSTVGQPEPE